MVSYRMDILDSVVDEKNLASTKKLPLNRLLNDVIVIPKDKSPNREPIFRRGPDQAEISNTGDTHLEGSRNGGGRECYYIHHFSHLLQILLMGNPESLFFVNDHQSKISESNILLEKAMCSDH